MHKQLVTLALIALIPLAYADSMAEYEAEDNAKAYFNERDRQTLSDLRRMDHQSLGGMATSPGEVVFSFGSGHPTIICSILEISDLALEVGEQIREVTLGDSARWNIESAISGINASRTEHLIIKPLASNLATSMVITTDRRTYHIRLKSTKNEFMPAVRFIYPKDSLSRFKRQSFDSDAIVDTYSEVQGPSDNNNYSVFIAENATSANRVTQNLYEFSGDFDITPQRVWHDGRRTYIQMPEDMPSTKLPALVLVEEDGMLFSEERLHNVNYRLSGRTYIVDGIITHARLLLGADGEGKSCDIIIRS